MIIQCEQCRTKFKLDDAKVKDKGVKVRCAKCRNVFTVSKEQQLNEKPDFSAILEQSAVISAVSTSPVAFELEQEPGSAPATGFDFDASSFAVDEATEKTAAEPTSFEFAGDEAAQPVASSEKFDISALALGDGETASAAADKVDFSGIAADGAVPAAEKTTIDSSGFAGLGDMDLTDSQSEQPKPDLEGFVDSIGTPDESGLSGQSKEGKLDEPFNLGEIDFGDDLAALPDHQINPEKTESDQDLLFVPLDEPEDKPVKHAEFVAAVEPSVSETAVKAPEEPAQEEELPPLPIASRRKSSSLLMIVMSAIGAAVVGLLIFFGMDMSSADKAKPKQEAGRIELRNVNASYVKNSVVGELLVITGEAVNNYEAPRAAIQVKGVVYGDMSKVLLSKNAFAGNPLSKEQLASMPLEKIEAAMANQFGDSLINMEVAPGKAVPFVVVIPQVPAEAKEFGLDLVGSTGAAPKK